MIFGVREKSTIFIKKTKIGQYFGARIFEKVSLGTGNVKMSKRSSDVEFLQKVLFSVLLTVIVGQTETANTGAVAAAAAAVRQTSANVGRRRPW